VSKGTVGVVVCVAVLLSAAISDARRQRPDLVVTGLEGLPATIEAGSKFEFRDTVRNKGRKADRTRNRYFLSKNKVRESSDLKLEGSRKVPKLKRGKASTRSVEIGVPGDATQGDFRLLACVDVGRKIRERRESNNCRASADKIELINRRPGDHTAPSRPVITGTDPPSPSSDNSPRVFGVSEPGRVRIFDGDCSGPRLGSGSAAAFSGAGGITLEGVRGDGVTRLRATTTDDAGNVSDCSAAFDYDEDSTPPDPPQITGTTPASPSASNTPAVVGTSGAPTVRIYAESCAGAPLAVGSGATLAAGMTVTVAENAVTGLRANATDRAGNTSGCSEPFAYEEDSATPTPTILGTTPASPADDETPEVFGMGAEAASTVSIYDNAACTGAALGSGGAGAFEGGGITVTVPAGTVLGDATTTLHASAVDALGNASGCSGGVAYTEQFILLP
jgi:hypothetical protein